MSKEKAQEKYDKAQEKHQKAFDELVAARQELDGFLQEEEAERRAVFMGFEPGDERGIETAKALADIKRENKAAVKAEMTGDESAHAGMIGGLS